MPLSVLDQGQRLAVLDEIFAKTAEPLIITDRNNLIVAVNHAFMRITGYREGEVLGRDPKILASGKLDSETYRAMWQSLVRRGEWQGEIWDRAKSGTTFPRWARISVLRNAEGGVENYVCILGDMPEHGEGVARIAFLAQHDSLTKLLNRAALDAQLHLAVSRASRLASQVAVLLIDLDRFKNINDTLGHDVGDRLLEAVAARLTESVRASDIVARLGGDEFVVVLPDIENALSVAGIASKIKRNLEDIYLVGNHSLYATPSMGVALYPMDGADPDALLKNADTAMYHAKSAGRNTLQFFSAAMNAAAEERSRIETGMRAAIETANLGGSEFQVYFQPQIHLRNHSIVSLEALARWTHPEWGPVPTSQFIPIAEETGLIQPLGDWVFWEACRQLRYFRDSGLRGVRVAVNLSAQQLRYEGLPAVVRGALACYDLAPSDLELEVTEATAMQNPAATISILGQLSDMGIVLSMDNFGTGYSSLSYLKHLPIHRLKLDRSFVKNVETDKEDSAICAATIALSHALGLEISAEGVETEGQRRHLTDLGCDILQGFFYSRPMPAGELLPYLLSFQLGQ
ncbi:MAG: EAL domain-containing protein [Rhodocyclaceae bacterium]|nr:EAL domain-containing protein [Rhodocyclaceae bacterium]